MRPRLAVLAAVALSALALAGCEKQALPGSPQAADASSPAASAPANKQEDPAKADPKALISNAAKTTRGSKTVKFSYTMAPESEAQAGIKFEAKGESDFKANRAKIETVVDVAGKKMTMSIVTDNGTLYMKTSGEGMPDAPWTKTDAKELEAQMGSLGGGEGKAGPGTDPMSFLDQIKDFSSVTPDGTETLRGVPTTRYKVVIDPSKVPVDEDAAKSGEFESKLWVDSQNRLARFQVGTKSFGKISADFFDYDSDVNIEVPKVG